MLKRQICTLLLLVAVATGASAEIGTMDTVPAATLLLPYFEVDLDDPDWKTTLFSINNARAEPAIAHVTLWTDWSVPTLDFNVYLTGYDVATFNLRDLFRDGIIPSTSHQDTTISPVGQFSLTSSPITGVGPGSSSCDLQLPLPNLPAILLDHIQAAHTGQPSAVFGGLCSGANNGDQVARGYITIDNVNFCTLDFPGDTGYFIDGGQGAANNENQLWGDYFFSQGLHNTAQGFPLVHIEASNQDPRTQPGEYTFYARYSGGTDNREALATTWGVRFLNGGAFTGGSDLLVWRDSKTATSPVACAPNNFPFPMPLTQEAIVIFDEQENPETTPSSPFSPPIPGVSLIPFPYETQKVPADSAALGPISYEFGWLYLNLNTTTGSVLDPFAQAWVGVIHTAEDRYSVGMDGIAFDNAARGTNILLPICDGDPDPAACP